MKTFDDFADADVWDSRDAIARIEWLEAAADAAGVVDDNLAGDMDADEYSELLAWREFIDDSDLPGDWPHGETFIADFYFEDHARYLAVDIGAISAEHQWPVAYIDWGRAADALRMDYTAYELGGHTFWARS